MFGTEWIAMPRKPNYRSERFERDWKKATKKEARVRSRLLGLQPDPVSLRTLIKTMSRRTATNTLRAVDVDCCLNMNTAPFAVRVIEKECFWVATAEYAAS